MVGRKKVRVSEFLEVYSFVSENGYFYTSQIDWFKLDNKKELSILNIEIGDSFSVDISITEEVNKVTFIDCKFKGFGLSNSNCEIHFQNCIFDLLKLSNTNAAIVFEQCIFSTLFETDINGRYSEIFFRQGCQFQNSCNIRGSFNNLEIIESTSKGTTIDGKFQKLEVSYNTDFDLLFWQTNVIEKLIITYNRNLKLLFSKNNKIKKEIDISHNTFQKVKFDKIELVNGILNFKHNSVEEEFTIENSTFGKDFNITESKLDTIRIKGNKFNGNINLKYIDASNLEIDVSSLEAKKRLIISDDNDSKIEKLIFKRLPPRTYLENLNIDELDLSRNTIEDKEILSLTNLKVNLLKIENFINYGFFTINNLKPIEKSKIEISNSTLGKLDLVSCDLSKVSVEIDNSKLVDIFYTDTKFPDKIESNKNDEKAKLEQQRDTYGQLKVVSEKVGNRFQALKFQAKEMAAYYESIELFSWDKFLDKVTLCLMKYSNNFRQSWILGVGFTLVIGLIPFYSMVASFDNVKWCHLCWQETFDVFGYYIGKYFEFINPAHKSDFLEKENTYGNWTYLWDFVGRIFIGFGIYQTIQAFRKFGKE